MCASHAYIAFDQQVSMEQLPISEAIRGLAGMAGKSNQGSDPNPGPTDTSVAVLVDAEVDGARYLLVRMPRPNPSDAPALSVVRQRSRRARNHAPGDRRQNIGHFRRVLVVVDQEATRLRLTSLLRSWGFDVVIAKHELEALGIVRSEHAPEFVILSRKLPGSNPTMDGLELCRQISSRPSECPPWILMLDDSAERQNVVESLESGAADHLPISLNEQELRVRLTCAVRSLERQVSIIKARDAFREQASRDGLTQLWNRNAILETLTVELFRAERNDRSTGILMLDLDHFKSINDSYGHLVGDTVLQETSRRLKAALRAYDSLGRYGGEEFLIVLPGTREKELCDLAERLRAAIEAKPVLAGPYKIPITLSIGAAIVRPGGRSAPEALTIADAALYRAKKAGRNRIVHGVEKPFAISDDCHSQLAMQSSEGAGIQLSRP